MNTRENYVPGPAAPSEVQKDGDKWTLVMERQLRHPPALVWKALTDPAQLAQWAPYDADRSLAVAGPVKLSTVGAPGATQVSNSTVKRAEAPRLLELDWGGNDMRWELEPHDGGTRLKLWHAIDNRYISWGAAGWQICFDVLDNLLGGTPLGRIVGTEAAKFDWWRLVGEHAKQLGVEAPSWGGKS